jgi:DNA methylase
MTKPLAEGAVTSELLSSADSDGFAGSGTTVIAAEKTGRRGYGLEFDPRYLDVAVRRWQTYTGQVAIHAETGLSFTAMAEGRAPDPPPPTPPRRHRAKGLTPEVRRAG